MHKTDLSCVPTNSNTRRQVILGSAMGLCGLAILGTQADA